LRNIKSEISQLKERIQILEAEKQSLTNKNYELTIELGNIRDLNLDLTKKVDELTILLKQKETAIKELKNQSDKLSGELRENNSRLTECWKTKR